MKTKKHERGVDFKVETPRATVTNRLLAIIHLFRKNGTVEEASEAIEIEKILTSRLSEESGSLPKAA